LVWFNFKENPRFNVNKEIFTKG